MMSIHKPRQEVTPSLAGKRVLVVEDDFLILKELESILIDAGAKIAGLCRGVDEALSVINENNLEAAVLDVRLEHGTVLPVARTLAKRGIPFIFYTGQVETDPIRREWPESTIIMKPASPRIIVQAVAGVLVM